MVPITVDTGTDCEVGLRARNNLPQLHPLLHLRLQKIVAYSQNYLAVPSCVNSCWYGVIIPTSFYTCTIYFQASCTTNPWCNILRLISWMLICLVRHSLQGSVQVSEIQTRDWSFKLALSPHCSHPCESVHHGISNMQVSQLLQDCVNTTIYNVSPSIHTTRVVWRITVQHKWPWWR